MSATRICASGVLDICHAAGTQAGIAGLSHQLSVLLLQDIDELRSWAYMAFLACPGELLHDASSAAEGCLLAAGRGVTFDLPLCKHAWPPQIPQVQSTALERMPA